MCLPTRIFLIGYRGSGKTTIARHLAHRLAYDWVDSDVEVELRAGKSIASVFSVDGEPAFRELESDVVADLCRRRQTVVALGGGAVLRESNRRLIVAAGPLVWLTATADTLWERIQSDPTTAARRPHLSSVGGRAEIETLLAGRTPVYRACATVQVDTEDSTPEDVVEKVLSSLAPISADHFPT